MAQVCGLGPRVGGRLALFCIHRDLVDLVQVLYRQFAVELYTQVVNTVTTDELTIRECSLCIARDCRSGSSAELDKVDLGQVEL